MPRPAARVAYPMGSQAWWDDHPEVRFPLRFALTALLAALAWAALGPAWPALEQATAVLVMWSARLAGISAYSASRASVIFGHGQFRYAIADGCTGLSLILLYGAAVIAFPATRHQRLAGLRFGAPTLLALNLVRLVFLGWVGAHHRDQYDTMHLVWGQCFSLAAVGVVWFAWAWRFRGDTPDPALTLRAHPALLGLARFVGLFTVFSIIGAQTHLVDGYGRVIKSVELSAIRAYWHRPADLYGRFGFQRGWTVASRFQFGRPA